MTPSDWIAIAAIAATVLVTIVNLIFNYFTNKQNIKAKRADIAIEKSIEVFRDFLEKLQILWVIISSGEGLDDPSKMGKVSDDLLVFLYKNRLFFPASIFDDMLIVLLEIKTHGDDLLGIPLAKPSIDVNKKIQELIIQI